MIFKLENILLDKNRVPAITDFGIAQLTTSTRLTATGHFLGTPHYMAPEQASTTHSDMIDFRSDLYAFGVISYLLLTGVFPFTGNDPIQLVVKHNTQDPPPPSLVNEALTPAVDAVLLRALAKHPLERYQSAEVFVSDLERAVTQGKLFTTIIDMERPNPASRRDTVSFAQMYQSSTRRFEDAEILNDNPRVLGQNNQSGTQLFSEDEILSDDSSGGTTV